MGWVKKDDKYNDHPKVDGLSDAAHRLWDICAGWCRKTENQHLDGFVPAAELTLIVRRRWNEEQLAALALELVNANPGKRFTAGLWEVCEHGWRFHDWQDYQPCDESPVLSASEAASRAGKASAKARAEKYGSAQPVKKTGKVSNNRTRSNTFEASSPNAFEDTPNVFRTALERTGHCENRSSDVREEKPTENPDVSRTVLERVHRTDSNVSEPPPSPFPLRSDLNPLFHGPDTSKPPVAPQAPAAPAENVRVIHGSNTRIGSAAHSEQKPINSAARCEATFTRGQCNFLVPGAQALWDAYRDESRKANAELTLRRREGFELLAGRGFTPEQVRRVVRGAKTDLEFAVKKHRLDPAVILFSPEQREKYLEIEAEERCGTRSTTPAHQAFTPAPEPKPEELVSAEEMQRSTGVLASVLGVRSAKANVKPLPARTAKTATIDPDVEQLAAIEAKRAEARMKLEQFNASEDQPTPKALEA